MRNTAPFGQIVTRREFLRHSATMFASLCVPKSVARFAEQKLSSNTDYSPVIKTIKQVLSAAMALKDNRSEYSNQGINLAGHVLEVTSRKPFAEFMREELLTPLGMTVSTFDQAKATQNEACALGYLSKRPVPI